MIRFRPLDIGDDNAYNVNTNSEGCTDQGVDLNE